jgi:phosphatidylserine decarboxylase
VTQSTSLPDEDLSITDNLKIAGQYCLPKHALSRLVGKLAAAELATSPPG